MRKLILLAYLAILVSSCGSEYKTEAATKELACVNNYEVTTCYGESITCVKNLRGANILTCTLTTVVED